MNDTAIPSPAAEAFERIKSAVHAELRTLGPIDALDFLDLVGCEIELLEEDESEAEPEATDLEIPALACESNDPGGES